MQCGSQWSHRNHIWSMQREYIYIYISDMIYMSIYGVWFSKY